MNAPALRSRLPLATDRLTLGGSGLTVSPLCLGLVPLPDIVPAAFDAGVNFFFLTADLHWPLYEGLRRGLELLLARAPSVRDQIVVGVVSYLDQPLFQYLQFNEVLDAVPGLARIDLAIAGAVPGAPNFNERYSPLHAARATGRWGVRATGASFHDRPTALACLNSDVIDVGFIRYNASHPGARRDLLPYLKGPRESRVFNFTTMLGRVLPQQFAQLGLNGRSWLPAPTDYYRFVLSNPGIDGLLCAPRTVAELGELLACLHKPPLTAEEEEYVVWLSTATNRRYF
jgi:hypothetical protein